MPSERNVCIEFARADLWTSGDLGWILDDGQRETHGLIHHAKTGRFVLEWSRRRGKSYLLCVLAIEQCLRKERSRVVYGAPTAKEVSEIIVPLIEDICAHAPNEYRPKYSTQSGHFEFRNGGRIVLFGCEDKHRANRGRGPGADLVLVDEAGFIPILQYVLHSVLNPQTLTTGGKTVIASTPSDEPDHDFTKLAEAAESVGSYVKRDIYDNPRLTLARIEQFVRDEAETLGMSVDQFKESPTFRREYLAQRVTDKTLAVMGDDWEKGKELACWDVVRPKFFDSYVALDMGGVDPHAVLFGYWHFEMGALVIEDELLLRNGENTSQLANAIKDKERELWGNSCWEGTLRGVEDVKQLPSWLQLQVVKRPPAQPFLRISDNDAQMVIDLQQLHGITFIPTAKDDKRLAVNKMRVMMRAGEIVIAHKCIHLQRHLSQTIWKNERQLDYRRKNGEHGDLLDCLVYMCRNVRISKNPMPIQLVADPANTWIPAREKQFSEARKLFGLNKIRRG